jgi:4-amino-4-deoxy-L-arabinose transferase-like glycosyltransferase
MLLLAQLAQAQQRSQVLQRLVLQAARVRVWPQDQHQHYLRRLPSAHVERAGQRQQQQQQVPQRAWLWVLLLLVLVLLQCLAPFQLQGILVSVLRQQHPARPVLLLLLLLPARAVALLPSVQQQ